MALDQPSAKNIAHVLTEALSDADLDAEFLAQFARQGVGLGLAGGDLAAGQFPQSGQVGRAAALGDEDGGAGCL